jgi:hypothetical protein
VFIRADGPGQGDLPALLDMLRYEGGQVIAWDHASAPHHTGYEVQIRVPVHQYVPDRWRSFGIRPEVIA